MMVVVVVEFKLCTVDIFGDVGRCFFLPFWAVKATKHD